MDLFVIDTKGSYQNIDLVPESYEENNDYLAFQADESENESDEDYGGLPPPSKDISHIIASATSSKSTGLGVFQQRQQTIKDFSGTGELKLKDRDITALDELIAASHTKESKKLVPIEHQRLDTVAMSNRALIKLRRVSQQVGIYSFKTFSYDDTFDT